MSKLSAAEIYAYEFENSEPNCYTRVPNIIDHLTYDFVDPKTGLKEIRRLSVYAKELYRIIRAIAGSDGACWMGRDKLADLCNMSAGQVTNSKRELTQAFHQLDGKPLIIITKMKKNIYDKNDIEKQGKLKSKTTYDKSIIVDIWKYNNAYMKTINAIKKAEKEVNALSENDHAYKAKSQNDDASQRAKSPDDTNKNNNNNNHLSIEQQPASNAPVVSKNKEILFPSDEKKRICYQELVKIGCESDLAIELSEKYNFDDLKNATQYMHNLNKKNKEKNKPQIENFWGYLRTVLRKRFWEKEKQ